MLNRKLSNYIFYGSLIAITVIIFSVRILVLGNLNTKINLTDKQNISLVKQIDALNEVVQDNKDIQTSHLYELYDIIPNVYSGTELTYKTVSILESLGIDESSDSQRIVYVNQDVIFGSGSDYEETLKKYEIVEVQLSFTTTDAEVVNELIDELFNSDQLFIINTLEYSIPDGENFVEIRINFLAIYDTLVEEES